MQQQQQGQYDDCIPAEINGLFSIPQSPDAISQYYAKCKDATKWASTEKLVYAYNWVVDSDGKVTQMGFRNVRTGEVYLTAEALRNAYHPWCDE
jgi:hypothetical protein